MNDKDYVIMWEKWYDPYGENISEMEFPGFELQKEKKKPSIFEDKNEEVDIEEMLEKEIEQQLLSQIKESDNSMKIIVTPMGPVPLTEETMPSKIFNFHVGHTNFKLTWRIHNIIDDADGVEILDIFTPYRFRIGIGKAFKVTQVRKKIERSVFDSFKPCLGTILPSITQDKKVIWPNR